MTSEGSLLRPKPVALIILDGFGLREETHGNAIAQANTPHFDALWSTYPKTTLVASGEAVGLPDGQMGNSEVGHLNIGAGRIVYQDLTRINKQISEGLFYQNETLQQAMQHVKREGTALHLAGLLSDGGVHSHIDHLYALLEMARREGVSRVYLHAFLDGRDVAPDSAGRYLHEVQDRMKALGVGQLATIQGRYYAMDRDRRWDRTERAYRALVYGEGALASDPHQVLEEAYARQEYDEFLVPTVLTDQNQEPIGTINSKDAVIFYNFRPDRAIQLSLALAAQSFDGFERGEGHPEELFYVSFTQYSETVPSQVAFHPVDLTRTLGEVLSRHGLRQLRIAETEKYPHVTYFFSGGQEEPWTGEKRVLIDSPRVATYDLKPEMSAYEVTEAVLQELEQQIHDVVVLNFANPDMVGHSGKLEPTIKAVEAVDHCLGQVVDAVLKQKGVAVIIADHGNADQVLDEDNQPHTAHTTNPVPCIVTKEGFTLREDGILADVAPTMLDLLGIDPPEEMTGKTLIVHKQ